MFAPQQRNLLKDSHIAEGGSSGGSEASSVRKINGLWFQLLVLPSGFAPTYVGFGYSGPNCTGTPYIAVLPTSLF